jgi:AcrR family transcriptional regulator
MPSVRRALPAAAVRRRNGAGSVLGGGERAQIVEIQRARMVSAMLELACELGAAQVTVAHVVERSGVSRRTFYEAFRDRGECFLAALDEALACASERVLDACRSEGEWRDRVRAGLVAFLGLIDEQPMVGRLLVCESLVGGRRSLERRKRVLTRVVDEIDRGRAEAGAEGDAPPLSAEAVVGGVLAVIHARLTEPSRGSFVELTGPLMSMIVLPYLGQSAARRELDRPVPIPSVAAAGERAGSCVDPFKSAGMRLTYRTVRVLGAVADNAQASNRTIGDAAGIKDQGQISKLLGRLERIGLIANSGLGPGQGAPNAWTLTPAGQRVVSGIHTHAIGAASES